MAPLVARLRRSGALATLVTFTAIFSAVTAKYVSAGTVGAANLVTSLLKENTNALKNPLKGWRGVINENPWGSTPVDDGGIPFSQPIGTDLESVRKWYVQWSVLESSDPAEHNDDGRALDRIRSETDRFLRTMPGRNMKAIPRIELRTKNGDRIPSDLPPLSADRESPFYIDPVVRARIIRLIRRCGQVWNGDGRVAAVQVGIVGKYGELWGATMMPDVEQYIHDAFQLSFPNKMLMLRTAGPFAWSNSRAWAREGTYGFFLDSFGYLGNNGTASREPEMDEVLKLDGGLRWQRAIVEGEAHISKFTRDPARATDGIFASASVRNYCMWAARYVHLSWLGSAEGSELVGQDQSVVDEFHKILGYRFVLKSVRNARSDLETVALRRARPTSLTLSSQVSHSELLDKSRALFVSLQVVNTGSAPFMGTNWPLFVSLLTPDTRQAVWTKQMDSFDISKLLPGTVGQDAKGLPASSLSGYPRTYTASQKFDTSALDVPLGAHVVALSVHDPTTAALRPALRFANVNYWKGGYHPVGVTVWEYGNDETLDASTFFGDRVDPFLGY